MKTKLGRLNALYPTPTTLVGALVEGRPNFIAIAYVGLRPGEKLHEALFHADERYRPTSHPKILQAEARPVDAADLDLALDRLRGAVAAYDVDALSALLREAVPEFAPIADEAEAQPSSTTVITFPARQARRT